MLMLLFVILVWLPYVLTRLILVGNAHGPRPAPNRNSGRPRGFEPDLVAEPAWGPLDDRQLTRLLTDSAPRTSTE